MNFFCGFVNAVLLKKKDDKLMILRSNIVCYLEVFIEVMKGDICPW